MKKWLKYSCMFAFIPAVIAPVITMSSCNSKKDDNNTSEDKPDPANKPDEPGAKTEPKIEIAAPAFEEGRSISCVASIDDFIENFVRTNGKADSELDRVLTNFFMAHVDDFSKKMADKIEVVNVRKVGNSKITVELILKEAFIFSGLNQRTWKSGIINYIQTKKTGEAPAPAGNQPANTPPTKEATKAPGNEVAKTPQNEATKAPGNEVAKTPQNEATKAPGNEVTKAPENETVKILPTDDEVARPLPTGEPNKSTETNENKTSPKEESNTKNETTPRPSTSQSAN